MITAHDLKALSERITREIGIHFPENRHDELEKRIQSAATCLGVSVDNYVEQILTQCWDKKQISTLAKHVTVSETYFFRDRPVFDLLEDVVLPELVNKIKTDKKNVIIWSTSCCTGEEPYSIAILLHKTLPADILSRVTILASDINTDALERARKGVYSNWSLRTTPGEIKDVYFSECLPGRFELSPSIRRLVRFEYSNLINPSAITFDHARLGVDLILCRNTLLYFTEEQAQKSLSYLSNVLCKDGWCLLGASEVWKAPCHLFSSVVFPGVIALKKSDRRQSVLFDEIARFERDKKAESSAGTKSSTTNQPFSFQERERSDRSTHEPAGAHRRAWDRGDRGGSRSSSISAADHPSVLTGAKQLLNDGQPAAAINMLTPLVATDSRTTELLLLLSDCFARAGDFSQSLRWIDEAISIDELNPRLYYMRAMVLHERSDLPSAIKSLKQAIFLDPDFVLAEFMLASLLHKAHRDTESSIHLENARAILAKLPVDSIVPESDEMTVGRLLEIINWEKKQIG